MYNAVMEVRTLDLVKTGQFIAALRRESGLTQKQLAERIGVTVKAVSRWETGKGFPDVSLLEPLAHELGISISELVSGERIAPESLSVAVMDCAVLHGLEYSRSREKRAALRLALGILLGVIVPLAGCLLWLYYGVALFWSDIPINTAAFIALDFVVIPIIAPLALRSLFPGKRIWLSFIYCAAAAFAATAILGGVFFFEDLYRELVVNPGLLRYDLNDTFTWQLFYQAVPLCMVETLSVNALCCILRARKSPGASP